MGYPKYVNFSYSILSYQFSQPSGRLSILYPESFNKKIKWNHAVLRLNFSGKSYMGYTTGIVVGKSVG